MTVDSSWVAFKHSWSWSWPWIGSYGIPSCINHRTLSTYQISLKSEKLLWTDYPQGPLHVQGHMTQKLGQIAKSGPIKFRYCTSLRISGHLPAAIVNGWGDRARKVQFWELQKPCDLDLGSYHMAYMSARVIDLYLRTKFHWNWKNFVVDGLTVQVQGQVTQKVGQI